MQRSIVKDCTYSVRLMRETALHHIDHFELLWYHALTQYTDTHVYTKRNSQMTACIT